MAKARRILVPNAYYHVMTRGNQKQNIFISKEDYETYLILLRKFKKRYRFRLYAYCLMPNHVHLLGEPEEPIIFSKFMLALNRTYTEYFNKKYDKVGHLWQGRFKSKIIQKDQYLFSCFSYIETNPLRCGLTNNPGAYEWSSYKARVLSVEDGILDQPTIF